MTHVVSPQIAPVLAANRARLRDPHLHLAPEIPPLKLAHARTAYALDVEPEEVLLLVDASVFGDATLGGMLSTTTIHGCDTGERIRSVPLREVRSLAYVDDPGGAVLNVNDVPTMPLGLVRREVGETLAHLLRVTLGLPVPIPPQSRGLRGVRGRV